MKTTIHCDERITNIRHTIYVKLFWGIIIANELTYLLDYFFKTSLNDWVIPLAPDVLIIWMSIKGVLFNGTQHFPLWCWLFALCYSSLNTIIHFLVLVFNFDFLDISHTFSMEKGQMEQESHCKLYLQLFPY